MSADKVYRLVRTDRSVTAEPVAWQGFKYSAALTIPANTVLVFAR